MKKIHQSNPRVRGKRGGKEGRGGEGGGERAAASPGAVARPGESVTVGTCGGSFGCCSTNRRGGRQSASLRRHPTDVGAAEAAAAKAGWWWKMIPGCGGVAGYPRGSTWIGCGMGQCTTYPNAIFAHTWNLAQASIWIHARRGLGLDPHRYLRCQTKPKEDIIARLWRVSWLPPALLAKRRVVNQIWKLKVRACEINERQARYTVAAIPTSNTEEEKQVVTSTRWQHDDPHHTAEI
jgi:hypothetical protein